jgi:segregation and condensation protein B
MSGIDPLHLRLVEALLFASSEPLAEPELARRLPEGAEIRPLLAELQEHYRPRGVNLVRVGTGWAFRTALDLAPLLARERRIERKLSRAAAETLAIIAYHQPVTRAEIEEIRGVQISKGTLDVLLAENWIRPRGRRQTPRRPITWGTGQGFLDHFGLASLDDLPNLDELRAAGLLDTRPAIQAYSVHAPAGEAAGESIPGEETHE